MQTARDQMQLIQDQTYRAIALGKHAQETAEWAMHLASQLLINDADNAEVKATRAEAARALGMTAKVLR